MTGAGVSRVVVAIFFSLTSGAAPLLSQTWQQKYCQAPLNPPQQGKCINKCAPGTHSVGPLYTSPAQLNGSGPTPLCRCVLNGTITPPVSYVHVHSISGAQTPETVLDNGNGSVQVFTGEPITITGCNFGSSGSLGLTGAGNPKTIPVPPTPNTPHPWSDGSIVVTVTPEMISGPMTPGSTIGVGSLVVEARDGNSNIFTLDIGCTQTAGTGVTPGSAAPGDTVQLNGCGFGVRQGSNTLSLASASNTVSTQGGPEPENISVTSITAWNDLDVAFQIPAGTPAGTYDVDENGKPTGATVTVTGAGSTAGAGGSQSGAIGLANPQGQQFTTPLPPLNSRFPGVIFQYTFFPLTAVTTGISPPAPQVWATFNTQTSIPVLVATNNATTLPLMIWQDSQPVSCDSNGPRDMSPDGNVGQWVQVPGNAVNLAFGMSEQVIQVPVTLAPGTNYLGLGGSDNLLGYQAEVLQQCHNQGSCNALQIAAGRFSCPQSGPYVNTSTSPTDYPNNLIGVDAQQVTVLPQEVVTLDAVPYTIVYQAPGDFSSSGLTSAVTSTIQYNVGGGTDVSDNASDMQKTCLSAGLTVQGVNPSYENCNSATAGNQSVFATQWTGSDLYSQTFTQSFPVGGITSLIPWPDPSWQGNFNWGDTYANEPFWYDGFVFLVNGQYAVYNNAGNADFRLMPTGVQPTLFGPVPVAFLAACAAGLQSPAGAGFPQYSNPCELVDNVNLSAPEALSALALDPFYPNGLGADLNSGCTGSSCRFQLLTTTGYTEGEVNPLPFSTEVKATQTTSVMSKGSYTARVTNVQTTTAAVNANFSIPVLNLPAKAGIKQSTTLTQGADVGVSYQSSTITTATQNSKAQVQFQDLNNTSPCPLVSTTPCNVPANKYLCPQCHPQLSPEAVGPFTVNIYEDTTYGTLLFTQPGAPGPPPGLDPQIEIRRILPAIMQGQQKFLLDRKVYPAPTVLKPAAQGSGTKPGQ